ncbi:MAG: DUF4276 family protein [Polyangiaceae bacterium]
MTIDHVEVLVEEPSAGAALELLLPKILGSMSFAVHQHQGKNDLLAKLPGRLRGYAAWVPATCRILVIIDRDNEDCAKLKERLNNMARSAQLRPHSKVGAQPWVVVNRIAIEELEAWYFGDWQAVRAAYPKAAASIPRDAKYRQPDAIAGGTWEAFERVMKKAGYFTGGLRKIEAARAIAEHMDPSRNTSPSFRALCDVLREMTQG